MSKPLFSVISPVYNSARFLAEAVASVQAQTLDDWELVLVDDASQDGSLELAEQLAARDQRIRVLPLQENVGPAKARNTAIAEARGRYLAFLDSDDIWCPEKLERQLSLLKLSGASLVYSAYEKVNETGARSGRVVQVPSRVSYQDLLRATVIATVTAVVDIERTGPIRMPDIRKRQDYAFWLYLLRNHGMAYGVQYPLAYLRKRPGSLSSNKLSATWYTWRVYREFEHLHIPASLYYLGHYGLRALRKSLV